MIRLVAVSLAAYFSVPILLPLYKEHTRPNYLGEQVPTGIGYAFLLPAVLLLILSSGDNLQALWLALLLLLFSIFGAIDDFLGAVEQKGFRGHFGHSRLSTGALKALGGGISSLVIAGTFSANWVNVLLNGVLIALAANFLNLLDLRPGRAAKAFLLLALPLLIFLSQMPMLLGPLFFAVIGFLPWDLKRRAMMGDTGANALGCALGFACAFHFPVAAKIIAITILAVLHIVAERLSFSKIIESNRVLQFLDRLGR